MNELEKLKRIAELSKKFLNRILIFCRCGELATHEVGDWSGSHFVCKVCADKECSTRFMKAELFGEIAQGEEELELFNLLKS